MASKLSKYAVLSLVSLLMWGCAEKQKVDMGYVPTKKESAAEYQRANLAINDLRDFVVNGKKDPSYIGFYRSGFGVPYDVNTKDNTALSKLLEKSIESEMAALGFVKDGANKKTLNISVTKWKFEAFQDAVFEYALDVRVLDASGKQIEKTRVENKISIEGDFWSGGKGGVQRDMPKIYQNIINNVLKDNKTILSALQS